MYSKSWVLISFLLSNIVFAFDVGTLGKIDIQLLRNELYSAKHHCEELEAVKSVNPLKVYKRMGNCVFVLSESNGHQSGFILMPPESSYIPINESNYEIKKIEKGGLLFFFFNATTNI